MSNRINKHKQQQKSSAYASAYPSIAHQGLYESAADDDDDDDEVNAYNREDMAK